MGLGVLRVGGEAILFVLVARRWVKGLLFVLFWGMGFQLLEKGVEAGPIGGFHACLFYDDSSLRFVSAPHSLDAVHY